LASVRVGKRDLESVHSGGMVGYDEGVIVLHADRLYRRAQMAVVMFTVLGALVCGLATGALLWTGHVWRDHVDSALPPLMLATLVGGLFGWALGCGRASALQLAAQVALCQLEIERNTRAR
jgi:hypothetical protein